MWPEFEIMVWKIRSGSPNATFSLRWSDLSTWSSWKMSKKIVNLQSWCTTGWKGVYMLWGGGQKMILRTTKIIVYISRVLCSSCRVQTLGEEGASASFCIICMTKEFVILFSRFPSSSVCLSFSLYPRSTLRGLVRGEKKGTENIGWSRQDSCSRCAWDFCRTSRITNGPDLFHGFAASHRERERELRPRVEKVGSEGLKGAEARVVGRGNSIVTRGYDENPVHIDLDPFYIRLVYTGIPIYIYMRFM